MATASACIPEAARGTHAFTVAGYRLHKGLSVGKFIRSTIFSVGGYDWCIRYYPDRYTSDTKRYVAVYVELQSKKSVVRALYDLKLTNQATGMPSLITSRPSSLPAFNSYSWNRHVRGSYNFMKRDLLEASQYLHDDCLIIHCDITVLLNKIPAVATPNAKTPPEIPVPPSDLSNNLAELLEGKKGADVVIKVGRETFYAHKIVLAMRSPVFDAELYGPMWDDEKQCLQIAGMKPAVFRALLHLLVMDDDNNKVIRHLLVAADSWSCSTIIVFAYFNDLGIFSWSCSTTIRVHGPPFPKEKKIPTCPTTATIRRTSGDRSPYPSGTSIILTSDIACPPCFAPD
ncbi:BTB/POZ and MATH domain-containing protein 1-like [Aegilops tauschii subsp. strangulata]|uniref:Speckle-type POZ protein-like protein B n=1 Tax=Aegilops tauschii TaxID=37682 RepID=N1R535_AEGTA|nr:BTB/POZ and MATH domain-containing protein 1-like [Triticum aestivum]